MAVYLEKVVFKEVSHGLVGGDVPPGVEVEVENVEPGDENESAELGLVTHGDQDHQQRPNQVLHNLDISRNVSNTQSAIY